MLFIFGAALLGNGFPPAPRAVRQGLAGCGRERQDRPAMCQTIKSQSEECELGEQGYGESSVVSKLRSLF